VGQLHLPSPKCGGGNNRPAQAHSFQVLCEVIKIPVFSFRTVSKTGTGEMGYYRTNKKVMEGGGGCGYGKEGIREWGGEAWLKGEEGKERGDRCAEQQRQ